MIDGDGFDGFKLFCDYCEEDSDETFDSFQEAVAFKTARYNGWVSVRDKDGEWHELCPSCNTPEVIAEIRGIIAPGKPRDDSDGTGRALKALEAD